MKLQMKIVLFFSSFVFVVSLIGGFFFYRNSIRQYEEMERANLLVAAEQLTEQMDNRLERMEGSIQYVLSNPSILEGIRVLSRPLEHKPLYADEARQAIRIGINTDFLISSGYRLIFFNRNGECFATMDYLEKDSYNVPQFAQMPYLDQADAARGRNVLIGPHRDNWGSRQQPMVYSMIKAVQGGNMGYVEVQERTSQLSTLQLPEQQMTCAIFINGDELLYSDAAAEQSVEQLSRFDRDQQIRVDPGSRLMTARCRSERYALQVLVTGDAAKMAENYSYILQFTLTVSLLFFLLAVSLVVLISHIITKPLNQLRSVIEHTNIENLGEHVSLGTSYDEIEALSVSYQAMRERLQAAMVNEKRLSHLHLQAQFDTLQAQINPHFLYNVLNIISSRGVQDDDDSICEMCGCLASMLRYSTGNRERLASVSDESTYLEQYFYLLKMRYEHKLSTEVEIDPQLLDQRIPKMTLQQLVENAMNHGLRNSVDLMEIRVRGWVRGNRWYLTVRDNGEGFSQAVLADLRKKFRETKEMILSDRDNMELEIGGMGLVNTYARCLILYREQLQFELNNLERGAEVTLSAAMQTTGELHVSV